MTGQAAEVVALHFVQNISMVLQNRECCVDLWASCQMREASVCLAWPTSTWCAVVLRFAGDTTRVLQSRQWCVS
jgi:hypothetical protein